MASCTASASLLKPQVGMRTLNKIDGLGIGKCSTFHSKTRFAIASARTKCVLNHFIVIPACTGTMLFLGRFVFLKFHREQLAKAGPPRLGDKTFYELGDERAREYTELLKTNDPAGFNIVDVLAWGSIGHIIAYWILATSSNPYGPKFF